MAINNRRIEFLRWLGVLPAAVLGAFAAKALFGAVLGRAIHGLLSRGGAVDPYEYAFYPYLMLVVVYMPWGAGPVLAGGWVAPRYRLVVAGVLATGVALVSLAAHVLVPSTVGFANYTHFAAETLGAAGGVAAVRHRLAKKTAAT